MYKGQSGRPKCQSGFLLRAPLAGELRGLAVSTVTAERDMKYSARLPAASDTLSEQKIKAQLRPIDGRLHRASEILGFDDLTHMDF